MKAVRRVSLAAAIVVAMGLAGALPAQAADPTPPVQVTTQPGDATVLAGTDATFNAAAQDNDSLDVPVQTWQSEAVGASTWSDVGGSAGQSTLTVPAVTAQADGTKYRALFDDGTGSTVPSNAATLTVHFAPLVTTQPASNQTVAPSHTFSLTAAASGNPEPTVQWQSGESATGPWSNIGGATSTTYTGTSGGTSGDQAFYRAQFSNTVATTTTNVAIVTTGDNPPPQVDYVDATNPAPGQLHAAWPAPDSGVVTSYTVRLNQGGVVRKQSTTTSRSITFTNLTAGAYQVSVVASNGGGDSDETFSASVSVKALKQTGTVSSTTLRPYHDGFQDTITLRATSNFAASGTARVLSSAGKVVRSFTISKRTSWAATFNGRTSSGHALPYGHYRVRFTLGSKVVATRTISLAKTQSSLTSSSFSPSTVYPVHDGFQDTTKLTLKTNMPATMTVTITKSGSSKVVASHKISLRLTGTYTWSAKSGGRPLPAGKYRAKIVVKGGDGSPRTSYRYVNVSAKKLVASKFTGYTTASDAYLGAVSGSPLDLGGRVAFYSDSYLGSDIGLFGVRLPASYGDRYTGITLYGCVDTDNPNYGNEVSALLLTSTGALSSRGLDIPDSGCDSVGVPSSYIVNHSRFGWEAGNVSNNDEFGAIDYFAVTVTIYKLK